MLNQALKDCELFTDLSAAELKLVSGLVTERKVPAGRYIIHEGEEAFSLFAVHHGCVDIVKTTEEGNQPTITELSDGSVFGEMSFFDHPSRSAGVKAHGEVTIFELKYGDLETIADSNPAFGLKLYKAMAHSMSRKIRKTTDDLAIMVAASRLAALGEMTTAISHEISNPLTSIMLNAELINRVSAEGKDNRKLISDRATKIRETVQQVVKIVDGLKNLARNAESDPFVETSVHSVVFSTLETCQEKFKISGTSIRLENIDRELSVPCRSVQIAQVLLNLLSNALDAVEHEREKWIRVEVEADHQLVHISVTNSGAEIPEKIRARIFQPFFTTKVRGKGTGLGLSISKSLVEAHGGILRLDSSSDQTRFVVSLPRRLSEE